MAHLRAQQGVALLTILIMVVLATILAMGILRSQQATMDETKMLIRQDQALLYAQSAEYFFSELLIQDAKDNNIDHLSENWAQPFPMFPVQDGFISGQLYDQQRKFNINQLLKDDGTRNEVAINYFKAMLKRLNLDENMVEAVIDWQDADDETVGAMGAENSYYQGLSQNYLAANQMFDTVEQLQLVRGFSGEAYQRLKPYVTALPNRTTPMNMNSVEPFLLACLSEKLDIVQVSNALLKSRKDLQHFSDLSSLWELDPFQSLTEEERTQFSSLFAAQSSYFTAEIVVSLSERQRKLTSWLYRKEQTVQSYQRSWLLDSEK